MASSAFGRYRLIAELGHGGMADVFLAALSGPAGLGFSKLVVIKRLRPNLAEDPDFISMLIDEARLAARLNHANVVQTMEVGQVDNQYFVAMEFLEGQSLHRVISRAERTGRKLSQRLHYRVIADTLAGLHHAHELADYDGRPLNVVHRDVTPHNVFVTYEGQVKIVDFGIAKAEGRISETRTGIVKGKVSYMAPEQASSGSVDRRADIFSVGVMLWEAAAGVRMWKGITEPQVMNLLLGGQIPSSPRRSNPNVPEELDRICRRALAFNPEERYPNAAEFQNDLEAFLSALEDDDARSAADGVMSRADSNRSLGRFVSDLFGDRRRQLKEIVERQLRELKLSGTGAFEAIAISEPLSSGGGHYPSISGAHRSTNPELQHAVSTATASGRPAPTQVTVRAVPRQRSRGWTRRFVAATLVASALYGAWALARARHAPQVAVSSAATSTAATSASAEATPSAVASASPAREVTVTLRAFPAQARFFMDDGAPLDNPFITRLPKDDREHTVRAEAKGYQPKTKTFLLDNDVVIDLALEKQPSRAVVNAVRQPSSAATADGKAQSRSKRSIDVTDPWR